MADITAGQTVLIHGAAGGVGTFAVQLAKSQGAHVIGTASVKNHDFLRELGADEVIDYNSTRFEEVVYDADVVLDLVGDDTLERSWAICKPGGMLLSTIRMPSEDTAAAHGVRSGLVQAYPGPTTLATITSLIEVGQIRPIVSTILPLQEISQAHALIESRHARGKIVLQVADG
jgi:NADPH:quinone reductase-like Zn-dependent oxidoreductase